MGAIIEFPADAASPRRLRLKHGCCPARRHGDHPDPSRRPDRTRRRWRPRTGRGDGAGSPPPPPGTFLTPDIFYAGDVDTDPDKVSAASRNSGCATAAGCCDARRLRRRRLQGAPARMRTATTCIAGSASRPRQVSACAHCAIPAHRQGAPAARSRLSADRAAASPAAWKTVFGDYQPLPAPWRQAPLFDRAAYGRTC